MKKASLISCIIVMLIAAASCKKPCYTCYAYVMAAYQIDTLYTYGQIRYDTSGGFGITGWKFETCETKANYHYGNYTQPFNTSIDTIIDCQQNNY
jgi:hypothetical protein